MEASCAQFADLFVSREERLVAVLGNDTAQTFFSTGSLADGFVVLSSRRVYFSGRCLLRTGKRFSTIKEERIVDVDSVTGTGFVHADPIWKRLAAITLLLVSLASFVYLIRIVGFLSLILSSILYLWYQATKRTIFEISYAGGGIGLDLRWITPEEADFFQKNLHLTRDVLEHAQERRIGAQRAGKPFGERANHQRRV